MNHIHFLDLNRQSFAYTDIVDWLISWLVKWWQVWIYPIFAR